MIPPKDKLTICFAHVAYQLQTRFGLRGTGIAGFEVRDPAALRQRVGEADVLVISGLWQDDVLDHARKLRFIQSIGAGTDQFPRDRLQARGMIGDLLTREDELGGKTLVVVGLGAIGGRLARLAKAFDMRVLGVRRNPSAGPADIDRVVATRQLAEVLPDSDFVALCCPLTSETERLIDAAALARMPRSAFLINIARGRVVDEAALAAALQQGAIAGAAVDVTVEEPLPAASPLWDLPNVLVTPHTAGETRHYEDNVIDILLDNLDRLWRGEAALKNQVL